MTYADDKTTDILDRSYRLIAYDWDGTAVPDRRHSAANVVERVEDLAGLGVINAVITGTNFNNINNQFFRRVQPALRAGLIACMNRGSEVFGFDAAGNTILKYRREATAYENEAMDEIAVTVRDELWKKYGLHAEIVFDRLNRRKIDIIPEPEWADPPKERIGELLDAVKSRLAQAGVEGGIKRIIDHVAELGSEYNIDLRLTTDVKHVELGLTDKSDSVAYLVENVAGEHGIARHDMVFLGDEFGPIDQFEGSDYKMTGVEGAAYVSVGKEPNGVPEGVVHIGGGVPRFLQFLGRQADLHRHKEDV